MLKSGIDVLMYFPDKAENVVDKLTRLDFAVPPTIDTSIPCDLVLPFEVDDTVYVLYLNYKSYYNGVTSWADYFFNSLFGVAGLYDECDVWTYGIVANSYENRWVGEDIKLRAGSLNIGRNFETLYSSQKFPDGKFYEVDTTVQLPYDMVNDGSHGGR